MKKSFASFALSGNQLVLLVSAFIVATGNLTFFQKLLDSFPFTGQTALPLLSLALALFAITAFLLGLLAIRRAGKGVLIVFLLLSALAAYFMDSYSIILNEEMLQNAAQTQMAESLDLLTGKLLLYVGLLGVLPAVLVSRVVLKPLSLKRAFLHRLGLLVACLLAVAIAIFSFSSFYATFFREHKALRSYTNPAFYLNSVVKFGYRAVADSRQKPLTVIGADAMREKIGARRQLFIFVVGETARADRFGLNGYERDTTPELRAAHALSFGNFEACGTSTAVSVPCMFSFQGLADFDTSQAAREENLLDILQRAGLNVLWLDNNSDSKGVALRVPYRNLREAPANPECDTECRDTGMLKVLQEYIDQQTEGDLFVVLHQMGNHGPAYFKRYPAGFEQFKPACQSNDLSQCSREEIGNAYDNALRYTDHFLGETIRLLQRNDKKFDTGLLYVSDHGESLGENGVYLHGMPRAIAPRAQLHVPAALWLGQGFAGIDQQALQANLNAPYSHDHLVHTLLGQMGVKTAMYKPALDILKPYRRRE